MPRHPAFDIGPPRGHDEALIFVDTFVQALMASTPTIPDWPQPWLRRTGPDNIRVARRDGRVVGGLVLLRMGQWFGGRSVPMTGISVVAVKPEHRATGVASALMKHALEEIRSEGMPLSTLYPATQPVYRKAGYEVAGTRLLYRIPPRTMAMTASGATVRPLALEDTAHLRSIYSTFAAAGSGLLDRNEWAWSRVLWSPDGIVNAYVAERAGKLEGYLAYVQKASTGVRFEIHVKDLVALTREAATSLLAFLGNHRSMVTSVLYYGAPADPLLMVLPEQELTIETRWDWMLRIVDVAGALRARGWPAGLTASLDLEITDAVLPDNAGRWRVAIADGACEAKRGGRGRVKLDVLGLAALYSGYVSANELARIGGVSASTHDLALLSAAFAGPAPWMPDMF